MWGRLTLLLFITSGYVQIQTPEGAATGSDAGKVSVSHEPRPYIRVKRSDDVSTSALEALVQQQALTIQTLQTSVQTLQAQFTALENKLPSSFQQVAFTVHFSTDDGNHGITLNSHQVLKFDAIVTNIGNGYDPQTGIFAAPVAGLYSFFLTQMAPSQRANLHLDIVKHGTILDQVFAEGSTDPTDQGSSQVTTHLMKGEQVWVRQAAGQGVRGGTWTVFTGYLVQAD